ncbi:MAG: hypothetical protein ACK5KP_06810 [Paludibacteraceae bacterium]
MIIGDTDLPKTGCQIELIGKIFSHVTHIAELSEILNIETGMLMEKLFSENG